MASNDICEFCFGKGQSVFVETLCTDCDEKLCQVCGENHLLNKAFKSHHIIQLVSMPDNIPTFSKYCNVHENMVMDLYCLHHNTACCGMCIPKDHQTCNNIVPLEVASKNVKNSSLLTETLEELNNVIKTLQTLTQTREDNIERLKQSVSSIKLQITEYKNKLVKLIDELEIKLLEEVTTSAENIQIELEKSKVNISETARKTEQNKEKLEFLKNHGTNTQLFLTLHNFDRDMQSFETEITELISMCNVTDITFNQIPVDISSIGTISKETRSCDVTYLPHKLRQAQGKVSTISARPITAITPEGRVQLKQGENYNITGIAVTSENKLLLCNFRYNCPKVYIYTGCSQFENEITFSSKPYSIAVIPGTNKAVVTLPNIRSITIINTINLTKEDTINLNFEPGGVAASADTIFIGGVDKIHLLNMNGKFQKEISISHISGTVCFISLYKSNNKLLCSNSKILCCVDLDGNIMYQYKVSGESGIALDEQENVYVGQRSPNELHRLSSVGRFRDKLLTINDGINKPGAFQFNVDFSKIFIINKDLTTVARFSCSS